MFNSEIMKLPDRQTDTHTHTHTRTQPFIVKDKYIKVKDDLSQEETLRRSSKRELREDAARGRFKKELP